MYSFRQRRSVFLTLAMLWHCLAVFYGNLSTPAIASHEISNGRNNSSQEFVVLSQQVPALAEVKRLEPVSKAPQNHSFHISSALRFGMSMQTGETVICDKSLQSFVPHVKRGYWLLYRALLL